MASFRSKLQIRSFFLTLNPAIRVRYVGEENLRHFWCRSSPEPAPKKKKKISKIYLGNCGKPQLLRMKLSPCGAPSECLETEEPLKKPKRRFFRFRKTPEVIKEKPTNCREEKVIKEKPLTLWEHLFRPDPKRSWPDPCICRLAHRQRLKNREQDPRLDDPHYEATPGDVLIYTELIKSCKCSPGEPQPKPPPSFKIPRAIMCKMMVEASEKIPFNCAAAGWQNDENCTKTNIASKPPAIPFEEMRPLEKRRNSFSCERGIRSEDVVKPFSTELNPYGVPFAKTKMAPEYEMTRETRTEITLESREDANGKVPRRSRIEQLKTLVKQKTGSDCLSSIS